MPKLTILAETTCKVGPSPHHCAADCEHRQPLIHGPAYCNQFKSQLTWDEPVMAYKRLVPCVTAEYQYKRLQQINEMVQAAPVVYACAAPGDGPSPEPSEFFDVVLKGYRDTIDVMGTTRAVRRLCSLDLPAAHELVKKAAGRAEGVTILWSLPKHQAEKVAAELKDGGARVELVESK